MELNTEDEALSGVCGTTSVVICSIIVGILVIFGSIGNGLTFSVFWKGNTEKSTSYLFMCLSLIDSGLMLSALSILVPEFAAHHSWLPEHLADMYPYQVVYVEPLIAMFKSATAWVTVLLAVNRYIIVCRPFKESQWYTLAKVKTQLAVVLLLAVLCNIPRFAEKHIYTNNNTTNNNTTKNETTNNNTTNNNTRHNDIRVTWRDTSEALTIYGNVLNFAFVLILPIIVLTVLVILLRKAKRAHRQSQKAMKIARNNRSVTFVLVIVMIVFVVCQLFALIDQLLFFMMAEAQCGNVQFYVWRLSDMLIVFNSAVNFFIFVIFNKRFRDVLTEKVCRRRTEDVISGREVHVRTMRVKCELAETSM